MTYNRSARRGAKHGGVLAGRKGVRAGASLEEIQQVYEDRLEAFVRTAAAICGGTDAGRDAVQDAFVSAVRGRGGFRGEGTVEAWLWRAVVRTALKRRSRARLVPVPGPLADREPFDEEDSNDGLAEARAAVARLPERQRLVLFLRYYGDLDYEQIAHALAIKRGTVSATLHAAHETLRGQLREVENGVR